MIMHQFNITSPQHCFLLGSWISRSLAFPDPIIQLLFGLPYNILELYRKA